MKQVEADAKESYTFAFLALIERLFVKGLIKNGNCSEKQLEKFIYPTLRGEKILALSEFLISANAEGVKSGHIENKIGWKGSTLY